MAEMGNPQTQTLTRRAFPRTPRGGTDNLPPTTRLPADGGRLAPRVGADSRSESATQPAECPTNDEKNSFVIGGALEGHSSLFEVATSFQDVRLRDPGELQSWRDSFPVAAQHADLFLDLHRTDPQAAHRLAEAVTAMPEVGSDFVGFRLLAELGRG